MTITGGPVFWILLVLAIVAIVTYFGRLIDLRRSQIDFGDFLQGVINVLDTGNETEALAICEETPSPVARIVAMAIRNRSGSARLLREAVDSQGHVEVGRLSRRLATLAIIGQIAPVLGLLGTILGFIKTVMLVNSSELVSRAELLTPAMAALVSAALGLVVAIPAAVMYSSLMVRLERMTVELEAAASQIIGYLTTQKEKEKTR